MSWDQLFKQAKGLLPPDDEDDDFMQIRPTFEELFEGIQKQLKKRTGPTRSIDAKADYWLFSKGIDLSQLVDKLEALNVDSLRRVTRLDIDKSMKIDREKIILSLIHEANRPVKSKNIEAKWSEVKRLFFKTFSGPFQNYPDRLHKKDKIQIRTKTKCCEEYRIERYFISAVKKYNKYNYDDDDEERPNLLKKFAKIVQIRQECNNNHKFWSIIAHMGSKWESTSTIDPIKRRQEKQGELIRLGKRYLENKYKKYMSSIVLANLEIAERGGVPDTINFIKGFVRVYLIANKKTGLFEEFDDKSLWSHVYFAMRCGEMGAIMEFCTHFDSQYVDFFDAVQEKIKHPDDDISPELEKRLIIQYLNTIKMFTDPFQKALFCIIIGHNVEDSLPLKEPTQNDRLWTQLSIVRTHSASRQSSHIEELTYSGLQSFILEKYGRNEKLINDPQKELDYFKHLILTGQFEVGIDFVARCKNRRSHAVHMAIALNEKYLLCTPRDLGRPPLSTDKDDPQPMKRLNVAEMILRFVKIIGFTSEPRVALYYYKFLRKYKHNDGRNLYLTSVFELVMKSKDPYKFFGMLHPSGEGKIEDGLLDELFDEEFDINIVSTMVAEELMADGMLVCAVYFFDLSGLHQKAMETINFFLSKCVHINPKHCVIRKYFGTIIELFNLRLNENKIDVEPHTEILFRMLRDLLIFFDLYFRKKSKCALRWLAHLRFIPMNENQLDKSLKKFKELPKEIINQVPDILVVTMKMLCRKYRKHMRKFPKPIDNDDYVQRLRYEAKILLRVTVSHIPNKIPINIIKHLEDLEKSLYSSEPHEKGSSKQKKGRKKKNEKTKPYKMRSSIYKMNLNPKMYVLRTFKMVKNSAERN